MAFIVDCYRKTGKLEPRLERVASKCFEDYLDAWHYGMQFDDFEVYHS